MRTPDPTGRRGRALPQVVTAIQGLAFGVLVGLDGGLFWRSARIVLALGLTVAAIAGIRHASRWVYGTSALLVGVTGVVTGLGIGLMHAVKGDLSVAGVLGLAILGTGGVLLVAGTAVLVRTARRWWRLLAIPVAVLILQFVVLPVTVAVYATNLPVTHLDPVRPTDRGLLYREVSLRTRDGVRLSAWYLPSTNGAAVVLLHGAGCTRTSVLNHAAVLSSHGYGVLMPDSRGHGTSAGDAMDFGWYGNRDIAAAVDFLAGQPEIRAGRIGAVGLSMGGEQAITAAAADSRIRAVVAEGVTARVPADDGWLPGGVTSWVDRGVDEITFGVADLLSGAPRPVALRSAITSIAPRRVMIIEAGTVANEVRAGQYYRDASPDTVDLWIAPGVGHTGALSGHAAEWETRVADFLDWALPT